MKPPIKGRLFPLMVAGVLALAGAPAWGQAANADLAVSVTNSVSILSLGQYCTVAISVANAGPASAEGVTVTNRLPAGAALVSASASQGSWTQTAGRVTCSLGSLSPGATAWLLVELRATAVGVLTNSASVSSITPDPVGTNNSASALLPVTAARFFGVGPMLAQRYTHTATLLTNGQVLVAGGWDSNKTERYLPATRTFVPAADLTTPRSKHAAVSLPDGRVLITGGSSAEFYNPATDTFRLAAGSLAMSRYDHSMALLSSGNVLLSGGGIPSAQSELFNPAAESSAFVGGMVLGFHYSTSTVLADGKVLVTGGYGPGSAAIYNPATANFSSTGEVLWWRGTANLLPNGKVLLLGYDYNLGPAADLYDPAAGTFTPTGPPIEARVYHTATSLPDGKVLVAGGFAYDGWAAPVRDSVEVYDWATGTFSPTARLNTGRAYHTATLLPDGSVLVAGGINNIDAKNPVFDNAEIYDPTGTRYAPSLVVLDSAVLEGDSGSNWLTFTVQLSAPTTNQVTAGWSIANGTAHSWWEFGGFDFIPASGTVVIPPGATNGTFSVPVLGDNIHEPDETVIARLNLPTHAWLARPVAIGTILNDDPLPAASVDSVARAETDTGVTEFVFNVTLSAPSLSTATVDYTTGDQTAVAGQDYQPTAGTLVFPSQITNLTVTVPVIGDLVVEPDETFILSLTNAQFASIAAGVGIGTILNDDGLAGRVHHLEVAPITTSNLQSLAFAVTIAARDAQGNLVTNFAGPIVLSALTTNVIGSNLDFEMPSLAPWTPLTNAPLPGPYTQAAFDMAGDGRSSTAFRINAGDGYDGISQDVWLAGGFAYKASVNFGFALGHNDCSWGHGVALLQLGGQDAALGMPTLCHSEQGRASVSLSFTPPTNGWYPLSLVLDRTDPSDPPYYAYADDVRISPLAFGPLTLTNLTNGVWSGLVTVTQAFNSVTLLADDRLGHQGFSNPFDVVPAVDVVLAGTNQVQGAPPLRTGMSVLFSLLLTNRGPSAATNVLLNYTLPPNVTFLSGTNSQGTLSNLAGMVQCAWAMLPKGSNAAVTLLVRADFPGTASNLFQLSSATAELNGSDNLLSLTNLIAPPLLNIADTSAAEASAATTGLVFSVTLSGASGQTILVDYFTADGTAAGGVDFVATNGTLTLLPGATNALLRVFPIDNLLDQPNRTFTLLLTNPVNGVINDGVAIGTVVDDDPPPTVAISNTVVIEGDSGLTNALFPVYLSKPAISNVTVTCSTSPGTATPGSDYLPVTNTLVFSPGTTNLTMAVQVRGDTVNEPDETFLVTLSAPVNATLLQAQDKATGVILNDDAVPGRIDHFVFDTLPSPQYTNAPFALTIRAVDFQGTPVPGFTGSASLSAQTDNRLTEKVFDDFEDGDLGGWTNFGGASLVASNVNDQAAAGARSLRLAGKAIAGSPNYGLRRVLTNGPPNRVSFFARAAQTNAFAGRFTLVHGRYSVVDFYFDAKGNLKLVNGNNSSTVPYQANHWYEVALELNWSTGRIDGRIDGAPVITNFPFTVDPNTGVDQLYLQNVDTGTTWFDEVHLYNLDHTNLFVAPTNLVAFENGVWSGQAAVWPAAKKAYLVVADEAEHTGQSGLFDVEPRMAFGGGRRLGTGAFQFSVFGVPGAMYVLQASTNLADWVAIQAFVCTNQPVLVLDPASPAFSRRFYRVAPLSSMPRPNLRVLPPNAGSPDGLDFAVDALPGLSGHLEYSTNLRSWVSLTNFQTTGDATSLHASFNPGAARGFYRIAIP